MAIDVAAAQAALDAAGGMPETVPPAGDPWAGRDPATGQFTNKPAEAAPVAGEVTPPVETTPAAPAAPETPAEDPFTHIDDASLTPELLQLKRSLQADYTRKTQEVAPWRKLGEELGVEKPEDFRLAAETYQRLQDPRNWPQIHSELSDYMQQYGMSPKQAAEVASQQLAEFASPGQQEEDPFAGINPAEADPSVAPLLQAMQAQQAQIKQLTDLVTGDKQAQQQQAQWNAVAQHLTSLEQEIRTANPHYGEEQITAIYNLMGPDGDLKGAQQKFESMIGAEVSRYITSKASAIEGAPTPVAGGGVIPQQSQERLTAEQGHAAAMAYVAQLDRADATS